MSNFFIVLPGAAKTKKSFVLMKKSKLKVDYEYDFGLLGIATLVKPYKLAWQLNKELNIRLVKKEDHAIHNKNNEVCYYTNYLHETLLTTIRLFRNKPNEPESPKWVLVPEHPHCDFVIMFKSIFTSSININTCFHSKSFLIKSM